MKLMNLFQINRKRSSFHEMKIIIIVIVHTTNKRTYMFDIVNFGFFFNVKLIYTIPKFISILCSIIIFTIEISRNIV